MAHQLGEFGAWRRARELTQGMAAHLEELGYRALWVGGSPAGDLSFIEELLDATERLVVVTGIVNMWAHDAEKVGASYHRVTERHPGRFLLGVGIGHPESTSRYREPYATMVGYLDGLDAAGVPAENRVLAALGPRALRLAGDRTRGAHPYLTTPEHTHEARRVLGAGPLLAPEHKVVWDKGPGAARPIARRAVTHYLGLVNYRSNLLRHGWSEEDLADGGSDRLVDSLVLSGDAEEIGFGLRAHLEAGADHVAIQVLGDDPIPGYRALGRTLIQPE